MVEFRMGAASEDYLVTSHMCQFGMEARDKCGVLRRVLSAQGDALPETFPRFLLFPKTIGTSLLDFQMFRVSTSRQRATCLTTPALLYLRRFMLQHKVC